MAEIGTVLAIIQIADRVVGLCKYWIEAVRDAPSDLRSILLETSMLRTVLENVEFLTNHNDNVSTALGNLSEPDGPVEHCHKILTDLVGLFPAEAANPGRGSMSTMLTRLAWPFKETKARRFLQELGRYKSAIALALTTESAQDIKDIKAKTAHMSQMLTESQRNECCRWLQQTDPSPLHNRALDQVEDGTCKWMLRSPDWADWLAGRQKCLWIHGIPGAGKTILASYLVEQVKNHCRDRPNYGAFYYYCYYGHNQDEAAPLLRWLLTQLYRKSNVIPDYIFNLFSEGCQPSLSELLTGLAASLKHFETVYLIVDAVDESMPREKILKVLRDLASDPRFSKIQLLATSREYLDIEKVSEEVSKPISMSNTFVSEDIQRYIQSVLRNNNKFKRWPQSLLDETEQTLCCRSKGMFRWVVCQLDRLQRMKCEPDIIRHALSTLPKTLDETYERIFLDISDEDRPLVRQCLRWIDYHNSLYNENIPIAILLQALDFNDDEPTVSEAEMCRFDEEHLKEVCGCLISISSGKGFRLDTNRRELVVVSFAHYTVREYLISDRISASLATYFMLEDQLQQDVLRKVFLTALRFELPDSYDPDLNKVDNEQLYDTLHGHFPSYCAVSALSSLSSQSDAITKVSSLTALCLSLLDASEHIQHLLEFIRVCQERFTLVTDGFAKSAPFCFWTLQWATKPSPTTTNAMTLFFILIICSSPKDLAAEYLLGIEDGMRLVFMPLQFRMELWSEELSDFKDCEINLPMIDIFAQLPNYEGSQQSNFILNHISHLPNPSTHLYSYITSHEYNLEDCFLERVLELGADPNGGGFTVSPIQIAVARSNYHGIEILLRAGADPNNVGDPNGAQWSGIFDDYKDLVGLSALLICQERIRIRRLCEKYKGVEDERKMIEEFLLRHGAEAFRVGQPRKCQLSYILNPQEDEIET